MVYRSWMKWFTSDTHYAHGNIAGPKVSNWSSGYRDFDSVSDMNDAIVASINDHVKEGDELYHLGDWAFGKPNKIAEFLDRIDVDTINLIRGNHDGHIESYREAFNFIRDYHEMKLGPDSGGEKYFTVLSHYAHRVWNKSHRGAFHLYGHSHHSIPDVGKSMDIGWCKYRRPLSELEIIEILKDRKSGEHHAA